MKNSNIGGHSTPKPSELKRKQLERRSLRGASVAPGDQVFLSYSRDDRDYVTKLAKWLKGHGTNVWFDHDIDYGAKWKVEIQNKLDASVVVLVVMSKSARRSSWVRREIDRAKLRKIPIMPVLLEKNGIVNCVADLQFENAINGQMPGLHFCQKLPGFLVSERDIVKALTAEQRDIARRIIGAGVGGPSHIGGKGPGVAALQVELLRVGLDPGPINGVFGEKTANAFREFQERRCHRPRVDGFVGPVEWMILANSSLGDLAPSEPATLRGIRVQTDEITVSDRSTRPAPQRKP